MFLDKEYERVIFVFGANRQGRHGKWAALEARKDWGAIYGQAEGLQGNSYGIVTKELRKGMHFPKVGIEEVAKGVKKFLKFAWEHKNYFFYVSPIGCGLAGFTPEEIAPLFKNHPKNVKLPKEFKEVLGK